MNAKWKKNPYICGGIVLFAVVAASMVFYRIISDFTGVGMVISTITGVLLPFIVGLALAYLLAPIYDFVEKPCFRLFSGKKETPRRFAKTASKTVASVASVLFLFAVVGGLLSMVIPQAYISISNLIISMPEKSREVLAWIDELSQKLGNNATIATWISDGIAWVTQSITDWAENSLLPNLGSIAKEFSTGLIDVIGTVANVIIGVIICVYTLNSKELFAAQAKKVVYSLFKTPTANYIVHMTRHIDNTFGRYINGMLLDALMVGVLCFIGTSLLRIPYALLISAIAGLFNIIPIFGPIIAAVIGTFFVLLEDPFKALLFLIFVLVLQQIDGNIIAPKILGDKTGLTGFWVIFAIVVGGGLFGMLGMILGVPTFAVIYALIQQWLHRRLQKKHIPDETMAYEDLWEIDDLTGEPKYISSEKEEVVLEETT